MAKRQAHGEGRRAQQKRRRIEIQNMIVQWILPLLEVEAIQSTGSLFPRGSLKSRRNRAIFSPWVRRLSGSRVLTAGLCRGVCRGIVHELNFHPPRSPTQSFTEYIRMQGKRFQILCKAAKKLKAMDNSETQLIAAWLHSGGLQSKLGAGFGSEGFSIFLN